MTRKTCSPVDASAPTTDKMKPDMKPDTAGEHLKQACRDLLPHEARKSVDASRDNGSSDGSLKGTKAFESKSRHTLHFHALWDFFAWLIFISAVNEFKLAPIADLHTFASCVEDDNGTVTLRKILSRNKDSSSSLRPHTTPKNQSS
ncbi:MAG: hypothetical protein Q9161_002012 [Pseudevernia consocians]